MTEAVGFQYAILRYVHDAATGEFLNVGLAMYSPEMRFFQARLQPLYRRVTATFPDADGEFFKEYISRLQTAVDTLTVEISSGQLSLLEEGPQDLAALLGMVLTPDDSSIQFGRVYSGAAADLNAVFADLYARLVERYLSSQDRNTRDDAAVWNYYRRALQVQNVVQRLQAHVIETKYEPVALNHAWRNGHWNALEPVSFDLMHPGSIQRKAREWLGSVRVLKTSPEWGTLYMLLGAPHQEDRTVERAYESAKRMLSDDESVVLVEENEAEDFAERIDQLIDEHQAPHR